MRNPASIPASFFGILNCSEIAACWRLWAGNIDYRPRGVENAGQFISRS